MSRFSSGWDSAAVLDGAKQWAGRCWIEDGSILFPDQHIWTPDNVEGLYEAFALNPQPDKERKFLEKLKHQIGNARAEVVKLAAEMFWFMLAWELDMLPETKQSQVNEILSWCGASARGDSEPMLALRRGIANAGQRYRQERPTELHYFLDIARDWKALTIEERTSYLQPWPFAEWLDAKWNAKPRALRHILLFFLFPDEFEAISSTRQKEEISEAFSVEPGMRANTDALASEISAQSAVLQIDVKLLAIRRALESRWGRPFSFYEATVKTLWQNPKPGSTGKTKAPGSGETTDDQQSFLLVGKQYFNQICDELRNFKNVILQGPPGVGKTFLARAVARELSDGNMERSQVCVFHPSYSYEEFVEGIRPNANGSFSVQNGMFRAFVQKALDAEADEWFVLILDEMNRGNASRIFGECLLLLERDKRSEDWRVPLLYSKEDFFIPPNILVLGLMNTADRSLAFLDYAFRRRFRFITLEPQFAAESFRDFLQMRGVETATVLKITTRLPALNERIRAHLGEGFSIGHSFFCPGNAGQYGEKWYRSVVELEIAPLLREYWHSDANTAADAIANLTT